MANTTWVYIKSKGESLWTVGFYDPSGKWVPESDHATSEGAAAHCHYLNGGCELQVANHATPKTPRDAIRKLASERRVGRG